MPLTPPELVTFVCVSGAMAPTFRDSFAEGGESPLGLWLGRESAPPRNPRLFGTQVSSFIFTL